MFLYDWMSLHVGARVLGSIKGSALVVRADIAMIPCSLSYTPNKMISRVLNYLDFEVWRPENLELLVNTASLLK